VSSWVSIIEVWWIAWADDPGRDGPTWPETGERVWSAPRTGAIDIPHVRFATARLRISALGAGESYAAWLATDGAMSLVFRLVRRSLEEMPCPMEDEFQAGAFIPDDLGSRPVAMDNSSDNPLATKGR